MDRNLDHSLTPALNHQLDADLLTHRVNAAPDTQDPADDVLIMIPWALWGALVVLIVVCTAVVFQFRPESWGLPRTIAAGFIGGALCHLSLYVNRILIADWGRWAK